MSFEFYKKEENNSEAKLAEWLKNITDCLKREFGDENAVSSDTLKNINDFEQHLINQHMTKFGLEQFIQSVHIMLRDEFIGTITQRDNCLILSLDNGNSFIMEISCFNKTSEFM